MKIFRYLCLVLSSLLFCLFVACSKDSQPIRIATHVWPGYEFLDLGQDLHYIPHSVAELVDTASATNSIKLLHQGDVDAATLTLDEVLLARSQGLDLTIILVMDVSVGADKIIAREPINDVKDLKSRTIAVENTAVGRLLMMKALTAAGLGLYDVEIMPVTVDEQLSVWQSDKADAIVTYEPVATSILEQGGHVVFDSSQIPETIVDVLAVKTEILHEQPGTLRALVSGFFKSLKHFLTNPQDAAYRISAHLNVPSHEVMMLYQGMELPSLERNRKLLSADNPNLIEVANDIVSLNLLTTPQHSTNTLTTDLYTDKFLQ